MGRLITLRLRIRTQTPESANHYHYTEWFTGLGNKPSVVWMDRQFGTKWRSENKEKVFYSVRKTIIDHVEDRRW